MTTEMPPGSEEATPSREPDAGSVYRPGRRRTANYGRRRQLRTRLLRASLLVLFIAGVGGLSSFLLRGREDRLASADPQVADQTSAVAGETDQGSGEEAPRLSAEEFESTLEREGVEVFRIRGARTSSDDRGNVDLKQVEIDYPRGEDHYGLRADDATYNEATNATHLEGSVSLEGTNGLVVETDWMDLAEGGMVLTAADDSRFEFGGVTARGDGLRMDFRTERASLGGGVQIGGMAASDDDAESSLPLSLLTERLEYRWGEGRMSARGGAELQLGDFELAARSLTLTQGEAGILRDLEARGDIELRAPLGSGEDAAESTDSETPSSSSTLVLRGAALDVQFDRDQFPSRVVLSGPGGGGPAVLRVDYGDGARQRVRARLLAFTFSDGVLADFEARGRVELDERVPGRRQPVREGKSAAAQGRFDSEGLLVALTLGGNVELTDRSAGTVQAQANRAVIDSSTRRVDFEGQPVKLIHNQGEFEAARVVFDQISRCSEASGGVQVVFLGSDEEPGGGLPFRGTGNSGGPARITAEEAVLCDRGESRFLGGVEVRDGSDLLLASQLRVSEDRRRMIADGRVRTLWHAAPAPASAEAETQDPDVVGEEWRIVAARMNYSEDTGELRFSGGASAELGEQSLSCDELTVEAAPAGVSIGPDEVQARTLHCLGNARLDDVVEDSSAEANRALYSFEDRVIRLSGSVVVRDGEDELRGPTLVYWLDEGRYEMGPSGSAAAGAGAP